MQSDTAALRQLVREEVDQAMLERVLPILSEQLVNLEHRLKEEFAPVDVAPEPPRLRVVTADDYVEESPEDYFWKMDQAQGQ